MSAVSAFLLCASLPALFSSEPEVRITWENCAANDTIVTKKEICYVVDLESNDSQYILKVCGGVNISGGTLVFGGTASSLLCATITINAESDSQAIARAEEILRKAISKRDQLKAASKRISSGNAPPSKVDTFSLKLADERLSSLLWSAIKELDTNPFSQRQ